ncbi:multiple inositol polyphosphate phosphatase 1-like [Epargyreus clarus]|uniref:multiple inositol polyphosphate phosphatase 1-like n=1 Tax=Epargyreus clarus TaxID=520877 RepID=UPI003C30A402
MVTLFKYDLKTTKMLQKLVVLIVYLVGVVVSEKSCYWNAECPYQLFSSKTPYDTIRGDIRDYPNPQNCEAVSIWSLHRHGNRNPGGSVTESIKEIVKLKDEIVTSFEAGRGQLCSQDVEEFRKWTWNETLEISQSFLTGTGYEELYDMGKRIRERYPHLLLGDSESYYFRPTNEQRTITSSIAFVHGLTENTNLTLPIDDVKERDDVIRPYQNCDRYQEDVKGGQALEDELNDYYNTAEFKAVQNAVQQRLGISTQLSADDIYAIYEICRFYRSWTATLQSPWCAAFSDQDLLVLEYRDDVRHYHRNGYGSWVNVNLGGPALKDFYENFEAAVQNRGKNIVSYFTHDTMMEMVYCAMGVFKDTTPIRGSRREDNRVWRTSFIGAFSVNFIAVLNRCQESGTQTYRVQLFINEKQTELCPLEGCTWQQFQEKFQPFTRSNLDFCSFNYTVVEDDNTSNDSGSIISVISIVLMLQVLVLLQR